MKKLLKLGLIIALIVSLAFIITGCSNDNEENEVQEQEQKISKAYNALNNAFSGDNYIISLEGELDDEEGIETITMAKKGENLYTNITSASQNVSMMYKDNVTYMILEDQKMYMTSEGKDESVFGEDTMIISKENLQQIYDRDFQTGKETIDGTEYDYEEYKLDDGTTEKYYFTGDDLKYIKIIYEDGTEEEMAVNALSAEVDDNLFEIPSDYALANQ